MWLADKLGEWAIQATLWLLERSKALVARMRAGSDEPRERKKKRRKVKPLPSVDDDTAEEIFERREPELDLDITLTTDEDDYEPDLGLFGAAEKKSMKIARADAKPKAQVEAENEATDETPETDDATQGPIDPLPSIALLDKPAKPQSADSSRTGTNKPDRRSRATGFRRRSESGQRSAWSGDHPF